MFSRRMPGGESVFLGAPNSANDCLAVFRRAILTPLAGGSASKIDPPVPTLFGCPHLSDAGGGGCWLWRRSAGYGASI